jgi:GPI ethanolamine phosphate transferase 2/3 subunit F
MSSSAVNGKPEEEIPPSKPIDLLQSQPSLFFASLQPILLLGTILVSFRSLVADPVNTLLGLAPTVAIVQAIYCVVCLPSTAQTSQPAASKPGQKKKAQKSGQDVWAKLIVGHRPVYKGPSAHQVRQPAFLSFVLTLTLTAPLLYVIIILFGAPLTTHHPHTLLLASHLSLLTTPPLFYVHGLDAPTWLEICSLQHPVDEVYGLGLGACLGSWVGAIPIPLDWDREWQKWPVTVVVGMYIGAVTGKLAGGYVFKGWKIKLS